MSEERLYEIIAAWPANTHIPGCQFSDLSYCLECHTLAYNALTELKKRHGGLP